MSKKLIIVTLLAAFLALAGYLLFNWYRGSSAAWKYIPSNAVVVISSEHLQDSSYVATEADIDLKRLPWLDIASDNLSLLNQISPDPEKLHSFLSGKSISYSFHPRTSTEWGVLMYIPVEDASQTPWLNRPARENIRILHHNFQDQKITDVSDSKSQLLFSYMIRDNYLIVSYYGDLIEDVVRASSLSIESFKLRSSFAKIHDSDYSTSLYLKSDAWRSVTSITNDATLKEFIKSFPKLQDYHIENNKESNDLVISASGSATPDYYLTSWIRDLPGVPFSGHKHISQQTSFFYRFGVEYSPDFKEMFLKWHKKNSSEAWTRLNYHIGKEGNQFLENFGSELILCQLEENNSINDGKILLARYSNYEKLRPILRNLARLSAKELNVSTDKFQGYDVYAIDIAELPVGLYGPMFKGFPRSYVTYIAPYLVISNNAQVLQNYIVDYENQLTWKQSPELDSVLSTSEANAQISMVVNLRKAQTRYTPTSPGKSYGDLTAKLETALFQCRYEGKHAYPSITLVPKKRLTAGKVLNRTFLNIDIEWPEIYDSNLAALQNPVDGSSEILLTDASNNLIKINDLKTGKTEAITHLSGAIVTNSYKVDFLNIGRQQRVFATADRVYAVDEDDEKVLTVFSKIIPSASPISSLYLVEGGQDGSSRFIIRTANQELFIWESVSMPIRRLNRILKFDNIQSPVVALNQIGYRGFIVTQSNGKIYLLGDKGLVKPGFPIDILAKTESPFTWSQNTATGQPEIVGVSAPGELIHIALSGKITSRRQLFRSETGSTFRLIFDRNSMDWILARTSKFRTTILDKEGQEIFTIKDLMPGSVIQYHFFGIDNRFITIRSGNYTTVFDMTGKRLGNKAIPSEIPVQLTYQPGYYKLLIFSRSEKKIQVWSIKLR